MKIIDIDKPLLYRKIEYILSEKANKLEQLIADTRASNNDTKSSMGDKYETSREMLQQEINNLQMQLNTIAQQQKIWSSIAIKSFETAEKGALVKTDKGIFYISVSLGEIVVDSQKIMCISTEAPLAKAMLGKSEGDIIVLNSMTQKIEKIL